MISHLSKALLSLTFCAALAAPAAFAQNHSTVTGYLNDETCELVSGDYGDPSATMHVISDCQGPDNWTAILHEYSSHQDIAFRYADQGDSGTLPILHNEQQGGVADEIQWLYIDGLVFGAVLSYLENTWMTSPPRQAATTYVVALDRTDAPHACVIGRFEGLHGTGHEFAAELYGHLFANMWNCAEDEMMVFTEESVEEIGFEGAVRAAARAAGKL